MEKRRPTKGIHIALNQISFFEETYLIEVYSSSPLVTTQLVTTGYYYYYPNLVRTDMLLHYDLDIQGQENGNHFLRKPFSL